MKKSAPILFFFLLAALCFLITGCASSNMDPKTAKANTGYVDLYCPENAGIDWEVRTAVNGSAKFDTLFFELNPVPGGVLRLAFAPGYHHLRVLVLNHVIRIPAEIEVKVENGKITPVRISFIDVGDVTVRSTQTSIGASAAGRYRRPVSISLNEANFYDLDATASEPVAYQPAQQMHYWQKPSAAK